SRPMSSNRILISRKIPITKTDYMQRKIFFLFMIVVILGGCKKSYNYSLDQTVSPVASLFAPQDSLFLPLNPASGAVVTFQWSPALAADGSLVQYEIAFGSTPDLK